MVVRLAEYSVRLCPWGSVPSTSNKNNISELYRITDVSTPNIPDDTTRTTTRIFLFFSCSTNHHDRGHINATMHLRR